MFYRFVDFDLGVSWRVSQLRKTTAPPAPYDHLLRAQGFSVFHVQAVASTVHACPI